MTNPSYTDEQVPEVVRTAPERIFLQVSDQEWDADKPFPVDCDGVSWWKESVLDVEVQYVRADLFAASEADRQRLQADADRWRCFVGLIDPDRIGGYSVYHMIDPKTDELVYDGEILSKLIDATRATPNETKEAKS